jgi:polyhydroxybutyrate depolymerase
MSKSYPDAAASGELACPDAPLEPGQYAFDLDHNGRQRSYLLTVPSTLEERAPLVLNFHGAGGTAEQHRFLTDLDPLAEAKGFVVAYPEGLDTPGGRQGLSGSTQSFDGGSCCSGDASDRDDVGFSRAVVADVQTRLCIDPTRVYAMGMSNGGFMAYRLACEAADIFAAAASAVGVLGLTEAECNPARPIPFLHLHGTADAFVPYEGTEEWLGARDSVEILARKNGCAGSPEVTLQQGAVTCESYTSCDAEADVTLCTIEGMDHCWPGQLLCSGPSTTEISANEAMWALFERARL